MKWNSFYLIHFILFITVTCDPECINDGVCVLPNQCECVIGYTGDHCQTGINEN